jgi:hypothetical protein
VTARFTGTFSGSEIEPGELNVPSLPTHVTVYVFGCEPPLVRMIV